jgi:hypothetical protein
VNAFTSKPDLTTFVKQVKAVSDKTSAGKARARQPGAAKTFSPRANAPKDTKCEANTKN